MNWDFFFRQLSAGKNIDETCFSFCDDPDEKEHYLGFIPHCDEPYWIGYCDVEGGCAFKTAEELVSAPVFDGKSIRERWSSIMTVSYTHLDVYKRQARSRSGPA